MAGMLNLALHFPFRPQPYPIRSRSCLMTIALFHPRPRRLPGWLLLAALLVAPEIQAATSDIRWTNSPAGRYAPLPPLLSGSAGFTRLDPHSTGIHFTNVLAPSRYLTNQVLPSGAGVAAGDVDGDGWCDLFFCGLDSPNRLYRNLGGWRFEDITEAAGLADDNRDNTGATFADLNGNGHLDLIVNSIGDGTRLYFNDGTGRFTAAPKPINLDRAGMTATLADVNGDGHLDLYIANYRVSSIMDRPQTRFSVRMIDGQPVVAMVDGRPVTDPELTNQFTFSVRMEGGQGRLSYEENGEPDALFLNDGHGGFSPVSFTDGSFLDELGMPLTQAPYDWGLSAMFRDLNGDGYPDLYVCNDFAAPDRIWINDGSGRFRAIAPLAIRQTSLASMAVDVADINRDGHDDIFVTDMLSRLHSRRLTQRNILRAELAPAQHIHGRPQYPRNTLLLNRGDGTFAEVAQYAGIEASEWSWTPIFLDVDLDGYEDLLIPNGFVRDNMNLDALARIRAARLGRKLTPLQELELRNEFPMLATRNLAFRNLGGVRFEEVGSQWGFDSATISQGMCLADLDNDGDLDVIVNNLNETAGIYRNNTTAPRVAVRLKGLPPNTRGIGARISLHSTALPTQSQEMMAGGRYLSADDTMRVFAAGPATNRMHLEVIWRSGRRTLLDVIEPNRIYELDEAAASHLSRTAKQQPAPPLFEDVSHLLSHQHVDAPFDDLIRQPLLTKRLSRLGPGIAWFDLNRNGWEDLIIGTGKGGRLAGFLNNGRGGFTPAQTPPFTEAAGSDQTTILAWSPDTSGAQLLIGSANYEETTTTDSMVMALDWNQASLRNAIPAQEWSVGPMALADINGDGRLELFVGGRVRGGQYPESVSSLIYRHVNGRLEPDEPNRAVFQHTGLVSGAVFSDLNGDGFPDLILACEWGPVRVFANDRGTFREVTEEWGFDAYTGWWNGVATGDFDGDGLPDIIASNWGGNTAYERRRSDPQRLYYGDLDGDGTFDLVHAHFEPTPQQWVPNRMLDTLSSAMPFLNERFPSHQAYARASIEQVLGEYFERARFLEAHWLESTVFLNRNGKWDARPLPIEAQIAPAFAVCVADYDGDGHEDVFLSQNFFAVDLDTSRYDAGRGLLLRGDGHGGFTALRGDQSGILIYGEQRGAAWCDYDADGRVDLVVAQNSAQTRLFHNTRAKPGLRVRLDASPQNPTGVGSLIRLKADQWLGPAREIQAGSGYWSQNSAVQVMSAPESPTGIVVRWPGGQTTTSKLPSEAREIRLDRYGAVTVLR
jgi:enediyne biosynthesis protein E4